MERRFKDFHVHPRLERVQGEYWSFQIGQRLMYWPVAERAIRDFNFEKDLRDAQLVM